MSFSTIGIQYDVACYSIYVLKVVEFMYHLITTYLESLSQMNVCIFELTFQSFLLLIRKHVLPVDIRVPHEEFKPVGKNKAFSRQ